ncbi:succinylglutamate desuccinylase/aspartoacylase family protein [Aggregatimonas sangjinii]|uniref:Succinylglutamate desuccinylase/aspartoacylase family protein n=1 Tax=Aggregatimonas sangjinii TaxID=2583587 RepID=A0A5B7SNQ7_9FLAO|nr:succinylglutamate desuccinylase/aspartoacylase family protein [Aggregatimonas sangjinii]QCW98689.1 succinylglutamate desuccinylase/aspartoacylase family protein [Aggregatimonas sangjinii]
MPTNQIEVLGHAISNGKGVQLNLDIAKLHTRTKIQVPIIVERAKKEGPTILITAGIHGNEINGVEIVRQLVSKKYNKPECGMVICIPVVNVFGFLNQKRQFPDGRDLNRVFPGSPRGSLASRFAYHIIKEIVPLVDYCIDFHTGGDGRFNIPQIRINEGDEETLQLAKVFAPEFIVQTGHRDKSFRHTLHKLDKKVLLFEGGKSLHIDDAVSKAGVSGALRVMQHLGIRDFSKELESMDAKIKKPKVVKSSSWIRATYSGMFHPFVKLGSKVSKGDVLGSISDPFGYFERNVKARFPGYVICINESPIVNQGDGVLHISRD